MKLAKIRIAKLTFKPGDMALIVAPGPVSGETAGRLKQHFEKQLPGVKVVVIANGLKIKRVITEKSPTKYRPSGGRSRTSHPKSL